MSSQGVFGRILILEDDEMRVAWFRHKFTDYHKDITQDVLQAIQLLQENEYTLILLDHDLIDDHYYSYDETDERTGHTVAAWLAANADCQRQATIIIHSLNFIGAERMLQTLIDSGRDAEHIPFPYLESEL